MDENYFLSGSLDAKIRIWSIQDRHVVEWSDLHEMVTAACYTPDGQVFALFFSSVYWSSLQNPIHCGFCNDGRFFFFRLKGALIGSHKGICRAYDTEGSFLSSF